MKFDLFLSEQSPERTDVQINGRITGWGPIQKNPLDAALVRFRSTVEAAGRQPVASSPDQQTEHSVGTLKAATDRRPAHAWLAGVGVAVVLVGGVIIVGSSGNDGEHGSQPMTPIEQANGQGLAVSSAPPKPYQTNPTADIEYAVRSAIESSDGSNPKVQCQGTSRCEASYEVELLGLGVDTQLMMVQRDVWREIFRNPNVRSGMVTLEGEVTTVGGKQRMEPILRVACSRAADRQIDWDYVDKEGMEALCNWNELVSFDS